MNTFKEAMSLPLKVLWKAASHKEVTGRNKNNALALCLPISVPTGHKPMGSRQDPAQGARYCTGVGATDWCTNQ